MKLFSVLDTKAGVFMRPFADMNVVQAVRSFDAVVNDNRDSPIAKFPDDFALMELGDFDEHTGKLVAREMPLNLATARSLVRPVGPGSA